MGSPLVIHVTRREPAVSVFVPGAVKVIVDSVRDISVASTPILESSETTSLTLSSEIGVGKVQVNCIEKETGVIGRLKKDRYVKRSWRLYNAKDQTQAYGIGMEAGG